MTADYRDIEKNYDRFVSAEYKDFRGGIKLTWGNYRDTIGGIATNFKDNLINDVDAYQQFHTAGIALRQGYYNFGTAAYLNVINEGSTQLAAASAVFGDAPNSFFSFGWGAFDEFQDDVCGDFADFHTIFSKESKKAINSLMKAGTSKFGQWNIVPPIVSGGALYPVQAGAVSLPFPLTGPLTLTQYPANNMAGNNGRLSVSGRGDSNESGNLAVELIYEEMGQMPVVTQFLPTITNDEWSVEFTGLTEGTRTVSVGYVGDTNQIQFPIHIQRYDF